MFNASLINETQVNTDPLIFASNGSASVMLVATGDLTATQSLSGSAVITLDMLGVMAVGKTGIGGADVVMGGGGLLATGLSLAGGSDILVSMFGDIAAGYAGVADAAITIAPTGDLTAGYASPGTATIEVRPELESYAVTPVAPYGLGLIEVSPIMQPYHRAAIIPRMKAELWLYGQGAANLEAVAAGSTDIGLLATGDARLGEKLYGQGAALIEFRGTGMSIKWHQVYGEGTADIGVFAKAERYGVPVIPASFSDAAPDCRFIVPADNTTFYVPKESGL